MEAAQRIRNALVLDFPDRQSIRIPFPPPGDLPGLARVQEILNRYDPSRHLIRMALIQMEYRLDQGLEEPDSLLMVALAWPAKRPDLFERHFQETEEELREP